MTRLSFVFSAVLLCLATAPAAAEVHALTDEVAGHPGVTYAMLLKQAVPDLALDGGTWKGSQLPNYRHVLGKEFDNGEPDNFTVENVDAVHARETGHDRLLLLTSSAASDGWFALLAAFDDSKTPKLLDSANIAADQFNDLLAKPVLPLAGNSDAIFFESTHWNSNQSYAITSAVVLLGGRFVPALTLFTISDHACGYARTQDVSFSTHGSDIGAKVVETSERIDEDCGDDAPKVKPGKHVFRDTWRWDGRKQRYVQTTGAIARLEKVTRNRN